MSSRWLPRLLLLVVSAGLGTLALEAAFRIIDGHRLTRLALVDGTSGGSGRTLDAVSAPDLRHVSAIGLAPDVDPAWYTEEPPPRPRFDVDTLLSKRSTAYAADPYTPFIAVNREYLRRQVCAGYTRSLGGLDDYFVFESLDGGPYPTYRHLPHVNPPGWFVTNNFGWRGPDIERPRAPGVIRIAFVGASTTVGGYGAPFSHPELIERWLNLWAGARRLNQRFEVINTGRFGINSRSIAAVVHQELLPIDPDLVVFYEGANQFKPADTLRLPPEVPAPTVSFRERATVRRYSALARRLLSVSRRVAGGSGDEPAKPPAEVEWPAGVNEAAPDPGDPALPMDLPQVIGDLDRMRDALTAAGSELAISSFIWLAHPGLTLDPSRHVYILQYLNETLWPIPYAHVRRMADFQNRTFEAYARRSHAPFIDIAREFPRDPDLFDDPIHLNYAGIRLQGWLYLQHLVRLIDERLADGRWPRASKPAGPSHPAFDQPSRRLMTVGEIGASCS